MVTMEQRRNEIEELVNRNGHISFANLKKQFPQISEMTLRTDLKALDEGKRIVRVHGGAKSVDVVIGTDDLLSRRLTRKMDEKRTIAEKAVQLIRKNTTIFLDSGSTTTALASCIPDQSELIYTNALTCAMELGRLAQPKVYMLGGAMNRYSMGTYGIHTIQHVSRISFDQAFMGVTGYCGQTGFNCGVDEEAILKRTVMERTGQVVVLMDSSKIDVKSTYTICGLENVDIIVSDGNLPEEFKDSCAKYSVEIL